MWRIRRSILVEEVSRYGCIGCSCEVLKRRESNRDRKKRKGKGKEKRKARLEKSEATNPEKKEGRYINASGLMRL